MTKANKFIKMTVLAMITIAGLSNHASAQSADVVVRSADQLQPVQEGAPEILSSGAQNLIADAGVIDIAQVNLLECIRIAAERIGEEARLAGEAACRVTASSKTASGLRSGQTHLEETAAQLEAYSQTLTHQATEAARSADERGKLVSRLESEQVDLFSELVSVGDALSSQSRMTPKQSDALGELRATWEAKDAELADAKYFVHTDRQQQERFEVIAADMMTGWAAFRESSRILARIARDHESFVKRSTARAGADAIYAGQTSQETGKAMAGIVSVMSVLNNIDDPNLPTVPVNGSDKSSTPNTFAPLLGSNSDLEWLKAVIAAKAGEVQQ